jgi:hypothetical protein
MKPQKAHQSLPLESRRGRTRTDTPSETPVAVLQCSDPKEITGVLRPPPPPCDNEGRRDFHNRKVAAADLYQKLALGKVVNTYTGILGSWEPNKRIKFHSGNNILCHTQ